MNKSVARTLVGGRVVEVKGANPFDEGLHASLLKDAHKRRLESLAGIRRNFCNGGLGRGALLDVAAGYLLEFEISGNVGGDENVGQLSGGHEELGHQINVPVIESAVVLPWLLASLEVSILFEQLFTGFSCQKHDGLKEGWERVGRDVCTVSRLTDAASLQANMG